MTSFLLIAFATLLSEDLTCIATGVLVAQGKLAFLNATAACMAGIFAGDLALLAVGRLAGGWVSKWRPAEVKRASAWLAAKGPMVVLLSRFTPGLRLPTYVVAGMLKTSARRFALYFFVAAALWTPLLVGATVIFGERSARWALVHTGRVSLQFAAMFSAAVLLYLLLKKACSFRVRRRAAGFILRMVRWEFWPAWVAYLPVVPYLAWLALKYRSLTLFTAANPGMPSGGFVGESKSQILDNLNRCEGAVARYELIPRELSPHLRPGTVRSFMERNALSFPVVLKPEIGERGRGVSIIHNSAQLEEYLRQARGDTIVQEYIEGIEFGVFYYRYPGEKAGHICSITEKRFPAVIGDGTRTFEELILRDGRAVCMFSTYLSASRRNPREIPAAGELVRLVEIGSHCRGSVFVDASHLRTPQLEQTIDRISKAHPGFFFGRYDLRAPSIEAFQAGELQVIELNGVSAEATHIYDPAVSLLQAYGSLFRQWRIAFEIGDANRRRGARPTSLRQLLRLVCQGSPASRSSGIQSPARGIYVS